MVTGAGRNIGRAIALAYAAGGANVVVNVHRNRAEAEAVVAEVEALGVGASVEVGDVGDPEFVEHLVGAAVAAYGSVDHVVHSAARRDRQMISEISIADWRAVIEVNFNAFFYLAKFALPYMVERRFGRVIAIGGPDGIAGASGRAHSVAAKSGILGFMKAVALEYGRHGITVNTVVPGPVDTTRPEGEYPGWPPPGDYWDNILAIPRVSQPEEIAYACRFLASPAAAFITGQTLHVSGGLYMP